MMFEEGLLMIVCNQCDGTQMAAQGFALKDFLVREGAGFLEQLDVALFILITDENGKGCFSGGIHGLRHQISGVMQRFLKFSVRCLQGVIWRARCGDSLGFPISSEGDNIAHEHHDLSFE